MKKYIFFYKIEIRWAILPDFTTTPISKKRKKEERSETLFERVVGTYVYQRDKNGLAPKRHDNAFH